MPNITNPRPNPYPGPRPFQPGETLYGRSQETWALFDLLIAERIVLLYSPSGAGKTSLIQAALIPALEQEGFRALRPMRAGLVDPSSLAGNPYIQSLLQSLEQARPEAQRLSAAELATQSLQGYLQDCLDQRSPDQPGDVLIFDQFEEILTLAPRDSAGKRQFFEELGRVLLDRNTWALFAMREEFIAPLDPYLRHVPTRLSTRYRLELLRSQRALEAIQGPARAVGVDFADAAAQKLVQDLVQADDQGSDAFGEDHQGDHVEPVHLQVVCRRLWEQLQPDQDVIGEDDVQAYGDVDQALIAFYEDAVRDVACGKDFRYSERLLRRWFDEQLITPVDTRGLVYRSEGDTGGLPNEAVNRLSRTHIVREVVRGDDIWYELAHDRLIRPILTANRQWRRAYYNPLSGPTRTWLDSQRDHNKLLQGTALEEAKAFAQSRPEDILGEEAEYLAESTREVVRATKRRRLLFLVVGTAVIVAATLIFGAVASAIRASNEAARAQELQASFTASSLANGVLEELAKPLPDVSLALILAREAVSQTWQLEDGFVLPLANRALLNAVAQAPPWELSLPRQRHDDELYFATYDPDGRLILTASKDDTAKVWDADSGLPLTTLQGHEDAVRMATFSPQCLSPPPATGEPCPRRISTASDDGTVMIWSLPAGRAKGTGVLAPDLVLDGHLALVRAVNFSPDGQQIVTASDDGTARVWNADSGQEIFTLEEGLCRLLWAAFSPSGDRIVTAGLRVGEDGQTCQLDGVVSIWDSQSRELLASLDGHSDWVRSAQFSPDGQQIVTASDDGTARIWDASTGQETMLLEIPGFWISHASFSPDGQLVATVTASFASDRETRFNHSTRVWDVKTGTELGRVGGHFDRIWSVAFSPDCAAPLEEGTGPCSARLLTASSDGTAKVWQPTWDAQGSQVTLQEVPVIDGHASWIRQARFSPDGTRIVTAGDDWLVKIWDAESGEELQTLQGHRGRVETAAFSADGSQLLTASSDQTARVWDLATGEEIWRLPHEFALLSAACSPDERQVVTGGREGQVTVWDVASQETILEFVANDGWVRSVAYSPDGNHIATAGSYGAVRVWDSLTGEQVLALEGHEGDKTVYTVAYSPDGSLLASASEDGTARIWDATTGEERHLLEGHTAGVMAVTFSPDGTQLVTAGRDNTVLLWDVATGRQLATLAGHTGEVRYAAFSPDGQLIVSAGGAGDRTARMWRTSSPADLLTLDAPTQPYYMSATYSPDGSYLVTTGNYNAGPEFAARVWDARTGQQVGAPLLHGDWANYAAFSPDGSRIVTAVDDGTAIIWDAESHEPLRTLRGHRDRLASARFSLEGDQVLTASWDGTARLWDTATGDPLPISLPHASGVNFATFSRDGARIVTASNDRTAKVWDAASGELLVTLAGHKDRVNAADLNSNGTRAVTGSDDRTVRVWDVSSGKELFPPLEGHGDEVVSVAFNSDGTRILTASRDGTAKIWDAEDGQELFTPAWHDQTILFAAYSPDSSHVVTINQDSNEALVENTITVWPSNPEALLQASKELIQRDPPVLTPQERRKFGLQ